MPTLKWTLKTHIRDFCICNPNGFVLILLQYFALPPGSFLKEAPAANIARQVSEYQPGFSSYDHHWKRPAEEIQPAGGGAAHLASQTGRPGEGSTNTPQQAKVRTFP